METHFNDFLVPKKEVAEYLMALGVKLDTTLAPAFVLAGSDVLLAAELSETLPNGADFMGALSRLKSLSMESPEPVLIVIQLVLHQLMMHASDHSKARLQELADSLGI